MNGDVTPFSPLGTIGASLVQFLGNFTGGGLSAMGGLQGIHQAGDALLPSDS